MRQNVQRPGQVHSGTMKRPGINLSRAKYVVAFAILYFKNRIVYRNICATSTNMQQFSTEIITAELHSFIHIEHLYSASADELRYACQSFHKTVKDIELLLHVAYVQEVKNSNIWSTLLRVF